MEFAWDPKKAASNLRKHGVSFNEAASVFGDVLSIAVPDPDHSLEDERFILVGLSQFGRLLIIAYSDQSKRVRLISARELTSHERKAYEEGDF